ncbi:glycoside hydrolase family 127 protein [Brachybacterium hainanense]|uniref:Glycoside hydrolase family 127 protein n=1 Tax=Brachybacterium hainanense TaxID=1541174 RepID=A0ABV6RCA5_9MICO
MTAHPLHAVPAGADRTPSTAPVGVGSPRVAPALPRPGRADRHLLPLDLRAVRLEASSPLGAWQERNAAVTIPHCIAQLEASGVIDNFRRVVGESGAPHRGFVFADSDLFKVIEAVAWEIGRSGTTEHDAWLDEMIALVQRVQEPTGYLHTQIQADHPERRFSQMHWTHELYVLGHWLQAAIALDRAADREDLLEAAIRYVDLVERRFGPGREDGIDGHPEIETALVELFRHTGEERFLRLAQHMVDQRGRDILPDEGFGHHYYQDHLPVREAVDPTGHAVRQLYLNAGVTDLWLETGEEALGQVMREQWDRVHERKMYLSGAFGSRHRDESFGNDYELPSDRAYAETCATIADLHWTWRLSLAEHDPRHADVIEREIHNALAASVDGTGRRFFYSNPMQRRPDRFSEENAPAERQEWYSCACCPPNIARLVAQISSYVAAVRPARNGEGPALEVLQLAAAQIDLPAQIGSGTLHVDTQYPADGAVHLRLDGDLAPGARIAVRIPGWAGTAEVTTADGRSREVTGEYVELEAGEARSARITLDMTPRWTANHPRVDATRGCLALERGPIVYCLEQIDMPPGLEVDDVTVARGAQVQEAPADARAHSGAAATTEGAPRAAAPGAPDLHIPVQVRADRGPLIRTASAPTGDAAGETATVTAVPFATWGNRGPGAMRIWIPTAD